MNHLIGISGLLFSLAVSANDSDAGLDRQLRAIIQKEELKGQPDLKIPRVDIRSPMAQLGKRLFFSNKLSGHQDTACVTCHHPALAGGDALSLPIGIDAVDPEVIGPRREQSPHTDDYDGGPNVPRNSPSTFNAVFYNRCMFWDCRIEAIGATPGMNGQNHTVLRTPDTMMGMSRIRANNLLEAQSSFPVTSEHEMRGSFLEDEDNGLLRETLAKRFMTDKEEWIDDFKKAFGEAKAPRELINFDNIAEAIAAYQISQIFVNNPWKKYVNGDSSAISENAKKGALLFFQTREQGGYNCAQCHSGDFFTDESFHVTAMPQIGRGKEDGESEDHDFGRFVMTGNPSDKFAFRTPSLLNVEVTSPYGHTGAYKSLRSVIRHMMNPQKAIASFDFNLNHLDKKIQNENAEKNTKEALEQLSRLQSQGNSKLTSFPNINENHVDQIYDFLISLTDPCTKQPNCLSDWFVFDGRSK
jgi:cytochrome c peroxidase